MQLLRCAGHFVRARGGSDDASPPRRSFSTLRRALTAAVALTVAGTSLAAQGGSVSGRVTDAATGQPVSQVRVLIAGTTLGTLTGENGRYVLRNLTQRGPITLDVNRIGYVAKKVPVTISATTPAVADVVITQSAFSLAAVVTTVTGAQRKVELANTTAQITVSDKLTELPTTTMASVLSGRAAGVQVNSDGTTGGGSRIRIRGQSSLSLSNDPVVVIDGIRVSSGGNSSSIGVGGAGPSRLDDINPDEIESMEVIKGPSAATLYGTEAANGVISIRTKRGKAGKTKYSVYSENGSIEDPNVYPDLWALWGKSPGSTTNRICQISTVIAGTCIADTISHGNVLNIADMTPIDKGSRQQYGAQISGGNDKVQFFVSGETEGETGIYKMPSSEITRLMASRGVDALPSSQIRPNALARNTMRANVSAQLAEHLFVQVSSGYINSTSRLPQNNDNGNGLMVAAIGGQFDRNLVTSDGVPLRGYRSFPMGDVLSVTTSQAINRFINSAAAQYNPFSWLQTRATVGVDFTARVDQNLNRVGEGPNTGTVRQGNITNNRAELNQQSVDLGGTITKNLFSWMTTKTSVGMQYIRNYVSQTGGTGLGLPPGATTLTAAATRSASQSTNEKRTLGYYGEELISVNEKLFFTAGLRRDAASAFGKDFRAVYYPKLGASWLLSEQSFFPKPQWLGSLRVRGTYGASGQIPGAVDALRYYSPFSTTLSTGTDAPGVSIGSLGNATLKPEYSAETETGFDLTMFKGKTNIEVTHYSKKTSDALISRRVAPSLAGVQSRFENIGDIQNAGTEFVLNQKVLDRKQLGLDFTLTASANSNELLSLPPDVTALFTGNRNTQRNQPGYPLYGLWGRSYTYADANADGRLAFSEMTFADSAKFIGPSFPTKEMAFSPNIELLNHKLRISSQIDRKWGNRKFNNTLRHQCQGGSSCRGLYDLTSPLDVQAGAIAANSSAGIFTYMDEDGAFARWRELSVSYDMPTSLARKFKSDRWNIVFTGRNLAKWTKYTGVDPEATVGNDDARGNEEYFSTAPMRVFSLRMNFSF